jgi:hypothetical protein
MVVKEVNSTDYLITCPFNVKILIIVGVFIVLSCAGLYNKSHGCSCQNLNVKFGEFTSRNLR